jgi:hypothetical protein
MYYVSLSYLTDWIIPMPVGRRHIARLYYDYTYFLSDLADKR